MPSSRSHPPARSEEETPVSVLAVEEQEEKIWVSSEAVSVSRFPPCLKSIISGVAGKKGMHRRGAILAASLGQCGWSHEEAGILWQSAVSAEERIFRKWFRRMNCPRCETMKKQSRGYPDLGVADLMLCRPDEVCQRIKSPVEYAAQLFSQEEQSKGRQEHIRTTFLVRLFNWKTGKEFDIDLTEAEKEELESLKKKQMERNSPNAILTFNWSKSRGRLRPRFRLMETEKYPLRRRILSELL